MVQLFVLPTFGGQLQLSENIVFSLQGKWKWLRLALCSSHQKYQKKIQEVCWIEASIE